MSMLERFHKLPDLARISISLAVLMGLAIILSIAVFFLGVYDLTETMSFISIFLITIIFLLNTYYSDMNHYMNQQGILRNLLSELEYLGGESPMIIVGEEWESHVDSYRKIYRKWKKSDVKTWEIPAHGVRNIDVNYYATGLDYKLGGRSTEGIKRVLYAAKDCIDLINYYNDRMIRLRLESENFDRKTMWDLHEIAKLSLNRLYKLCRELIKTIKEDFLA